jgi:putative salt-induced outer membrane protein YdiY
MVLQDQPPAKPEEKMEAAKRIEAPVTVAEIDLAAVETIEQVKPYYRYNANIDLGANSSSGNTKATNLNLSAALVPSFGKNTVDLSGQLNRGKADGDLNTSNWLANGQYEREFWRKWFAFVVNRYEHDKFQDLDLRISAGAGLGYKFFEPDPTLLRVSLAPAYVNENFSEVCNRDDEGNVVDCSEKDRQFAALLWATNFDQDLWSPDVSIYHNHRLTVGLTEDQFLALTAQGLKFELIDDFNLKLEFQLDHNNSPSRDAKQNDYRYLVKLGYDFEGDENDWLQ